MYAIIIYSNPEIDQKKRKRKGDVYIYIFTYNDTGHGLRPVLFFFLLRGAMTLVPS